jgi:hypothetical protein
MGLGKKLLKEGGAEVSVAENLGASGAKGGESAGDVAEGGGAEWGASLR